MAGQLRELEEHFIQMRNLVNEMVDTPKSTSELELSALTFRNTVPRRCADKEVDEETGSPHSSSAP